MLKKQFQIISLALFLLTFCSTQIILAQSLVDRLNVEQEDGNVLIQYFPSLRAGTHINEIGYHISPALKLPLKRNGLVTIQHVLNVRLNATNFGIDESSFSSINRLYAGISWRKRPEAFDNDFWYGNLSKNTFRFYYTHYASTDRTNQLSGGAFFTSLYQNSMLEINLENDFLAFRGLDEFRTGAAYIDYRWFRNEALIGVGFGMRLWTGTTQGLDNLDFGEVYNMTGQFGSEFSHGVLSLRLHYESVTLELGYDSDEIRSTIQDKIHEWIDDGIIPDGTRSRDLVFIKASFNTFRWLY